MRWVITGTNRGIGLELTRQLLERGDVVDAAARRSEAAGGLQELAARHAARLRLHACDVRSDASVLAFGEGLEPGPVDVLVNNAGVMGKLQSLEDLDLADMLTTLDTNALGAVRVTRAVLPRLGRGGKIVHITSGMGSISDNTSGGAYGYRMSKAALNMASRSMAMDLKGRGIASIVVNPGWVKTDMGGGGAPLPVEVSAANIIGLIDGLKMEQTGAFLDHSGREWGW
jgi:NAD(P)-dependent dehydrogenase (short-subunit alcohol dehydrogenase family)